MKRMAFLMWLVVMISCSDGDLQIEAIDFNSVSIEFCESQPTTSSTFFFKINGAEALILELDSGLLKNEVSTDTIVSTIPSGSQLTYRFFSENVSSNYFCDNLPPAVPSVVDEIAAEAGEVLLTTIQSETDSTVFEHTITLKNISLVSEQGERITNTTIDEYGTFTTQE